MSADFVYVIEAQNGLVKIGASIRPKDRLQQIRLYCPILARLVAMWQAPRGEELRLHAQFDAHRSHKEWFRVEGKVIDFLSEVWGRGVGDIPGWHDLTFHEEDGKARLHAGRSRRAKAMWADPVWRAALAESKSRHRAQDAHA